MKVLLDTKAFLRWTLDEGLPRRVKRRLSRPDTQCYVSIVSVWEICIKKSLNRRATEVEAAIQAINARLLPIEFMHLDELTHLAWFENHRDPFDRLLVAQAISEDLTMISSDQRFTNYQRLKLLWD